MIKISEFTEDFGFSESQLNSNNKLELPYPINSDWQLHLKLFESVKLWTEGKSWNESYQVIKKCSVQDLIDSKEVMDQMQIIFHHHLKEILLKIF